MLLCTLQVHSNYKMEWKSTRKNLECNVASFQGFLVSGLSNFRKLDKSWQWAPLLTYCWSSDSLKHSSPLLWSGNDVPFVTFTLHCFFSEENKQWWYNNLTYICIKTCITHIKTSVFHPVDSFEQKYSPTQILSWARAKFLSLKKCWKENLTLQNK